MTLLPLSCLCVSVWAWSVICHPATQKHKTDTREDLGNGLIKMRHARGVPSMGVAWYPCGEDRCVCNATHANCRDKSLHYIPKFPHGVTSLDFSKNEPYKTERAEFFDNVTDVVWIDFSNNRGLNFSFSTFQRLKHLTSLDLTFSYMPCRCLSAVLRIPSLEVLKLQDVNGCEGLEFLGISTPIPRLRELDLTHIQMRPYLSLSYLSPFTGLRRLSLRCGYLNRRNILEEDVKIVMFSALRTMNLTYIHISLARLSCESVATLLATPSLQELRLERGTDCQKFDFTLEKRRTSMTRLDLSHNQITEISPSSLPAGLKYLDVSQNTMTSMQFVTGLPHLEILEMRGNLLDGPPNCDHDPLQQLDPSENGGNNVVYSSVAKPPSCPQNLRSLYLHGNSLAFLSVKVLLMQFSYFQNLVVLDISGQGNKDIFLSAVRPKRDFGNARLTLLNLAANNIDFKDNMYAPVNTFERCPNLANLSLANNDLSAVSEDRFLQLFGHLVHLQDLSLRSTGLRFITSAMFSNFGVLRTFDLSHNSLIRLPDDVFEPFNQLRMLNLSFNRITVIKEKTFSHAISRHRLQHVDLSDNPFTCSCDVLWFRSWLLTTPSVFAHSSSDYLCANLPDTPITSFSMTEQACLLSQETSRFIIATVSLIFLGLSSLTFVYRYRWHIRLVLHEVFRGNDERARHLRQHSFQYDVFVCYDSEDFPWVRDHLMPSLEEGMGLKLCLHHRDFIPGTPIVDNIQDSVVDSKKMLMLFSRQFAQSPWCQFELRLCLTHAMDTQDMLIVVLLEDIPSRELTSSMMAVMKTTTYIEWADEAEARKSFWRRMWLALHEVLPGARV